MRGLPKAWVLLVAVLAAFGCGSDSSSDPVGPGGLAQSDLVGTWNLTKLEFQEDAPGTRHFDLVGDGGGSGTITIGADGSYTLVMTHDGAQETNSGKFEVTADGVVDTSEDQGQQDSMVWQFTRSANTLTGTSDEGGFDFDQDDSAEEQASVSVAMQKAT
jgi:lipocalin-like protein